MKRTIFPNQSLAISCPALVALSLLSAVVFFGAATVSAQEADPGLNSPIQDRKIERRTEGGQARPVEPGPGRLDMEIIRDVKKRQMELDQREERLKKQEARINTMRDDLDRQITELKTLHAKIEEQIQMRSDLEIRSVKRLAKAYAAMPPENAAVLISKMDTKIVIRVLGAMRERSAGRILAETPPELASKISEGIVKKH